MNSLKKLLICTGLTGMFYFTACSITIITGSPNPASASNISSVGSSAGSSASSTPATNYSISGQLTGNSYCYPIGIYYKIEDFFPFPVFEQTLTPELTNFHYSIALPANEDSFLYVCYYVDINSNNTFESSEPSETLFAGNLFNPTNILRDIALLPHVLKGTISGEDASIFNRVSCYGYDFPVNGNQYQIPFYILSNDASIYITPIAYFDEDDDHFLNGAIDTGLVFISNVFFSSYGTMTNTADFQSFRSIYHLIINGSVTNAADPKLLMSSSGSYRIVSLENRDFTNYSDTNSGGLYTDFQIFDDLDGNNEISIDWWGDTEPVLYSITIPGYTVDTNIIFDIIN